MEGDRDLDNYQPNKKSVVPLATLFCFLAAEVRLERKEGGLLTIAWLKPRLKPKCMKTDISYRY